MKIIRQKKAIKPVKNEQGKWSVGILKDGKWQPITDETFSTKEKAIELTPLLFTLNNMGNILDFEPLYENGKQAGWLYTIGVYYEDGTPVRKDDNNRYSKEVK